MNLQLRNPDFEARVRDSFARQAAMALIGARMTRAATMQQTLMVMRGMADERIQET